VLVARRRLDYSAGFGYLEAAARRMMARMIRRLWAPCLLLAALAGLAVYGRAAWTALAGTGTAGQSALFDYAVPTALWLAGAWVVSRVVDGLLWDQLTRSGLGRAVPRLMRDALTLIVFMVALGGILAHVFGYPLTGFFAASSVMALVIGLALRNVILDIFTGLAINLDRSYQIDDWIEVHHRDFKEAVCGRVVDINWRTTRIEREDAKTVVIPNNLMSMFVTTNYSKPDRLARFDVVVPLDFGIPTERAMRLLLGGVMAAIGPRGPVGQPAPSVLVGEIGERGVEYRVRYYIRMGQVPPNTARSNVLKSVLDHLATAGIEPAYPKEDVFHARMPARERDWAAAGARLALLRKVELLACTLEPEELGELAQRMEVREFRPGEQLIRQGDPGRSMFVLAEGVAEVARAPESGGPATAGARLYAGQPVGEMALLTGAPHAQTARALTEVVAFEIASRHIEPLLEARPELAGALSWQIAERRLRQAQTRPDQTGEQASQETQRLSQQILARMRALFGGAPDSRRAG
jgi:small-conductance mechanosensitive channel/CRP-like cAMP-binding protein